MTQHIQEKPVQIIVNGRAAMTLMTAADNPEDLVIGQLYTERVIKTYQDISSLHTDGPQTSVVTTNPFGILLSRKTVLAGCGGASSYLDSGRLGEITSSLKIPADRIRTGTAQLPPTDWHSGGLYTENGTLLTAVTDITSQNVLDRIIGWGLSRGTDFPRTYLILSGNIVTETVRKAIIAKIPLLATTGAATVPAVTAADDANLALLQITGTTILPLGKTNRLLS